MDLDHGSARRPQLEGALLVAAATRPPWDPTGVARGHVDLVP